MSTLEHDVLEDGAVSPITPEEIGGMTWWNSLTEDQRAAWCRLANTATPAQAWAFAKEHGEMPDEDRDEIRHNLCSSEFWFSPHVIPQYDLLVAQGLLGSQEANEYQALRRRAGLAMDIEEVRPHPCPELAWVAAAGGPSLQLGEPFDAAGIVWSARYASPGTTPLNACDTCAPGGYLDRSVRPHWEGKGFVWSVTWKLPDTGDSNIYARSSGLSPSLHDALRHAVEHRFVPEDFGDVRLYGCVTQGREHWVGVIDDQELEVSPAQDPPGDSSQPSFYWTLTCNEGTPQWHIAQLFGTYGLRGRAASLKAVVEEAGAAMACLRQRCEALVVRAAAGAAIVG